MPVEACQSQSNRSQNQTGDLTKLFRFKKSSRVMLTNNIGIDDQLVLGQRGTIVDIKQNSSGILSKIYVNFQDENVKMQD